MSIRPLTGMVHALLRPGIFNARFISAMSSSREMWSGVIRRNSGFIHSGAHDEYQVAFLRHSLSGFNVITVSSIDSGAGSVAVSALPAFPSTRSTSGKRLIADLLPVITPVPSNRDSRHRGRHVQQRALVQRRHEL